MKITPICFLAFFFYCLSASAASLTLNVTPGNLQEQLLNNPSTPDELILVGELNSVDLKYINLGKGKIANVTTLDISHVNLVCDEGTYSSGKDDVTIRGGKILFSLTFVLSDNPRVEKKSETDLLGRTTLHTCYYANNLAGLFYMNQTLKKVILPSYISTPGSYLCAASSIEEVVLPTATTEISDYAFAGSGIRRVNTDNIVSIGEGAFRNAAISTFNFSKIRHLGLGAFSEAEQLTGNIELTEVGEIPDKCFYRTSLNSVNIGKGIFRIGASAFSGTSLTSAYLSEGLEYIDDGAFGSKTITTFNVPSSVVGIGVDALPWKWVEMQPAEGNVIYFGRVAYQYIDGKTDLKDIVIKEGTKMISPKFAYNSKLSSVFIPASVNQIGANAFYSCEMNTVTFADDSALERVGESCFRGNDLLKLSTLPASLKYIGAWAFAGVQLPGNIILGKNLKSIDYGAFNDCKGVYSVTVECDSLNYACDIFSGCGIEQVYIKDNVTCLPKDMFEDHSNLIKVDFGEYEATEPPLVIEDWCFHGCTSLSINNLPQRLIKIGNSPFGDCKSGMIDRLPVRLVEIGESAFEKFQLPANMSTGNITTIEAHAFDKCSGLVNLEIENSVTTLESGAFSRIESFKSVYYNVRKLPDINISVTGSPFESSSIVEVVIGKDVEVVPSWLFNSTYSLTSIVFEPRDDNKPLKIHNNAFSHNYNLWALWLPDFVTEIDGYAFYDSNLAYLHLGKGLRSIGSSAFAETNIGAFQSGIDIPETIEYIGKWAFPTNKYYVALYCHSQNPPEFSGNDTSNITFYAPEQSVEAYQKVFPVDKVKTYYESGFTLSGGEVLVGETYGIYPKYTQDVYKWLDLAWESSNPEVFRITDDFGCGALEVTGEGSAILTARFVHHDGVAQTCEVYTKGFDSVDDIAVDEKSHISIEDSTISGLSPEIKFAIYNIYGESVYAGQVDEAGEISIPYLDKGIYILKTETEVFKIKI